MACPWLYWAQTVLMGNWWHIWDEIKWYKDIPHIIITHRRMYFLLNLHVWYFKYSSFNLIFILYHNLIESVHIFYNWSLSYLSYCCCNALESAESSYINIYFAGQILIFFKIDLWNSWMSSFYFSENSSYLWSL